MRPGDGFAIVPDANRGRPPRGPHRSRLQGRRQREVQPSSNVPTLQRTQGRPHLMRPTGRPEGNKEPGSIGPPRPRREHQGAEAPASKERCTLADRERFDALAPVEHGIQCDLFETGPDLFDQSDPPRLRRDGRITVGESASRVQRLASREQGPQATANSRVQGPPAPGVQGPQATRATLAGQRRAQGPRGEGGPTPRRGRRPEAPAAPRAAPKARSALHP